MPAMCGLSTTVYMAGHLLLHDQMRDLFAAQSPSGQREKISEHLRHLIEETFQRAREDGLDNEKFFSLENVKLAPTQLKWFLSSTLEPFTLGTTKMKTGVLVGLPSFYNYFKPSDVPDKVFEIEKLSLLRLSRNPQEEQRDKIEAEAHIVDPDKKGAKVVRKIDRNSEEGKKYQDSLLLSDNAKKYSIARELFLGDTFRPLLKIAMFFISCSMAVSVSRASVIVLKAKEGRMSYRMTAYLISGILGYGNFKIITQASDRYYAKYADERAKGLGEEYVAGAEEYYAKRTTRETILGIN